MTRYTEDVIREQFVAAIADISAALNKGPVSVEVVKGPMVDRHYQRPGFYVRVRSADGSDLHAQMERAAWSLGRGGGVPVGSGLVEYAGHFGIPDGFYLFQQAGADAVPCLVDLLRVAVPVLHLYQVSSAELVEVVAG